MKTAILILTAVLVISGCNSMSHSEQRSEASILAIAEPAIAKAFPETYSENKPYHANLHDGIWTVRGTLPSNVRGGTPEAKIRDSDCEVIEIYHTQ